MTTATSQTIQCGGAVGSAVTVVRVGRDSDILNLAEIDVKAALVTSRVARVAAVQSTLQGRDYPASNAIDGNVYTTAHTQKVPNQWLAVQLDRDAAVHSVSVWNGALLWRLNEFQVWVGPRRWEAACADTGCEGTLCGTQWANATVGPYVQACPDVVGRWVAVRKTEDEYLHVGEIEVDATAVEPSVCAEEARCASWYFPGSQVTDHFRLVGITMPMEWTLEARVKFDAGHHGEIPSMFSVETVFGDHCALVDATLAFPTDGEWHVVTLQGWESGASIMIDGETVADSSVAGNVSGLWYAGQTACGGDTVDFVLGGNISDIEQTVAMRVNYVALYSAVFSNRATRARVASGCAPTSSAALWGLWYGDSGAERSGSGNADATLTAATLAPQTALRSTGFSTDCAA
jgi:hypothetical protein